MHGAHWFLVMVGIVVFCVLVGFAVLLYIYRVRLIANRVGSFELAYRPIGEKEWTSGIGVYATNALQWHRTVSLSLQPKFSFPRGSLVFSEMIHRADSDVIEVQVANGDQKCWLAMHESSYNGLVSWIDSSPPVEEDFYASLNLDK